MAAANGASALPMLPYKAWYASIPQERLIRAAAFAGMVGPVALGGTIAGLTIAQYAFLRDLRWHPLNAPTTDWPSGLALGPYGWLMVVTFVGSGVLLAIFAVGLHAAISGGNAPRSGATLLGVAGLAMMLLGFKIDPTYGGTPRTLHGAIHDWAFGVLGLSLILALAVLSRQFDRHPDWRGHARYTLVTGLLVAPAFALKGLLFYLFLANTLAWIEITAIRLWQIGRMNERP